MPSERGRILGIGGIFFKSANQQQMREWYGKHLGLADKGGGVMMPWREKDNPENEHVTVWTVFPGNTKYFEPSQAFMVNYIVDDMDALLERLQKEGVKIDPKRQDEDYGKFAWIYDPDGNKIELWQPVTAKEEVSAAQGVGHEGQNEGSRFINGWEAHPESLLVEHDSRSVGHWGALSFSAESMAKSM